MTVGGTARLFEVLCWGAGAAAIDGDPPPAALLEAAEYHRLGSRLLRRARRERPAWLDADLLDGLERQHAEAEQRVRTLNRVACEIVACFPPERVPITLKGSFGHLLTGGGLPPRWSGDLDLLPRDFEEFAAAVRRLGFEPFDRDASPHELGYFARDSVVLDVHRSVSVYARPAVGIASGDLPADRLVEVPAPRPEEGLPHELRYDDLARHSRVVSTEHGRFVAPGPELAVLLAAAHTLRNYISIDFPIPYGTARLGELADLVDVAGRPEFDAATFRALVERHRGADSVGFTRVLLAAYLGADGLARACREPVPDDAASYGRCLWWDETTASLYAPTAAVETPAELAVRTIGIGPVVDRLGANAVPAGVPCSWAKAPAAPGGKHLAAGFAQGPARAGACVTVEPARDALGLRVLLADTPLPGEREALYLNFGDLSLEFEHDAGSVRPYDRTEGGGHPPAGATACTVSTAEGGRSAFRVRVPWEELGIRPGAGAVPLLLGVRRWGRGEPRPSSTTLLPLRLEPPSC